ncbi:hypothetical protein QBC39DRAFT_344210 [Podospora conica]|nr:hypothetical protein QBC39DRAFT_344210 [Schizothecium conicum]
MKLLPIAALAGIAHAAPFNATSTLPMNLLFNVTDFQAYSVPHTGTSYVHFAISVSDTLQSTLCDAKSLAFNHIGDVFSTDCSWYNGENWPVVSFSLNTTADNSATLVIWWSAGATPLRAFIQGTYRIPEEQLKYFGTSLNTSQHYTGPEDFLVSNFTLYPYY